MVILGIDPGTARMGYGIIKSNGGMTLVSCGIIKSGGATTQNERLSAIEQGMEKIIGDYGPEIAGIEKVFFSRNKTTAISVAEARGVALAVLSRMKIPVIEFSPTSIKSVVAGNGRCDKGTLAKIVALTLGVDSVPGPDDVSDALATAIRASFEKAP